MARRPRERLVMISIAAEMAGMHPQTLRVYERRGLIAPRRTPRNTRVYSEGDILRLRRIQGLSEEGLNLAGIERVLKLEERLERAERRIGDLAEELRVSGERHRQALADALAGEGTLVRSPRGETGLVPAYRPVVPRTRTLRREI